MESLTPAGRASWFDSGYFPGGAIIIVAIAFAARRDMMFAAFLVRKSCFRERVSCAGYGVWGIGVSRYGVSYSQLVRSETAESDSSWLVSGRP
jgi:hypothetical protein